MNKGFPHKILGLLPIGWSDLGYVLKSTRVEARQTITSHTVHTFCNSWAKIGKEKGELFMFCSRCMIKLEKDDESKN